MPTETSREWAQEAWEAGYAAGVAAERARLAPIAAATIRDTEPEGDYYADQDGNDMWSENASSTLESAARRVEAAIRAGPLTPPPG